MSLNIKLIPLIFTIVMVGMIGVVSAQETTNDDTKIAPEKIPVEDVPEIMYENDRIVQLEKMKNLRAAHSVLTDLMIKDSQGIVDEEFEEIFVQYTFVDEETQTLVVGLDPIHLFLLLDEQDISEHLPSDVLITIQYGHFVPEFSSKTINPCPSDNTTRCYIWDRYVDNCLLGSSSSYCSSYESLLIQWGYTPPARSSYSPDLNSSYPCILDNRNNCYIWDRYVDNCISDSSSSYCYSYESLLIQWGYTPPTKLSDS